LGIGIWKKISVFLLDDILTIVAQENIHKLQKQLVANYSENFGIMPLVGLAKNAFFAYISICCVLSCQIIKASHAIPLARRNMLQTHRTICLPPDT